MLKKCISITLAILMLFSVMITGVSAAKVDEAPTGESLIYFDAASAGWQGAEKILFYIYNVETSQELAAWGSKKLRGTKLAEDSDIWSFDPTTIGMVDGTQYAIIFNNADTTEETYQLLLDSTCYGDTAYWTGNMIENPVDSSKTSKEAKWRNSSLGPMLAITSLGNVVGETCPAHTTPYAMFVKFLISDGKDGLQNAINYSGKSQEEIIKSVSAALGLTDEDVEHALYEAGMGGDPGPIGEGFTVKGSITSYLSDEDAVSVSIAGSGSPDSVAMTCTNTGYEITGLAAGDYTLTFGKKNHVTRTYEIKVSADMTLDAKICPIGDVTMDGKLTTMDVTRTNAHVKGTAALEGYALLLGDTAGGAGITTIDVTRINSHVQGKNPLW